MANKNSAILNPQREMANQTTIYSNLKQEIICTTKDKMTLLLQQFRDAVSIKEQWVTRAGIALSFLLSLVTSTPKDTFGLSADVWQAIFIIAFIVSTLSTATALIKLHKTKDQRNIEKVCQQIMSGSDQG